MYLHVIPFAHSHRNIPYPLRHTARIFNHTLTIAHGLSVNKLDEYVLDVRMRKRIAKRFRRLFTVSHVNTSNDYSHPLVINV